MTETIEETARPDRRVRVQQVEAEGGGLMPEETKGREVLRIVLDEDDDYAVILPGDGEWAKSEDPRLLESYVSLILYEEFTGSRSRLLSLPRQSVRVEAVGS